jgi:hypothetical protein
MQLLSVRQLAARKTPKRRIILVSTHCVNFPVASSQGSAVGWLALEEGRGNFFWAVDGALSLINSYKQYIIHCFSDEL